MNAVIVTTAFLVLFISVEFLQKFTRLENNITRRIAHILSGIFVFFLPNFLSAQQIVILSVLFAVFLYITKYFRFFSSIHKVDRKTLGEIYFPLGVGISAFFFLPQNVVAFQFGVLVLTISDAFGGLIGEFYGKHIIFKHSKKSFEGSAVFLALTYLLFLSFTSFKLRDYALTGLISAASLTFLELILAYGLDNLFLPSVSALLFATFVAH